MAEWMNKQHSQVKQMKHKNTNEILRLLPIFVIASGNIQWL